MPRSGAGLTPKQLRAEQKTRIHNMLRRLSSGELLKIFPALNSENLMRASSPKTACKVINALLNMHLQVTGNLLRQLCGERAIDPNRDATEDIENIIPQLKEKLGTVEVESIKEPDGSAHEALRTFINQLSSREVGKLYLILQKEQDETFPAFLTAGKIRKFLLAQTAKAPDICRFIYWLSNNRSYHGWEDGKFSFPPECLASLKEYLARLPPLVDIVCLDFGFDSSYGFPMMRAWNKHSGNIIVSRTAFEQFNRLCREKDLIEKQELAVRALRKSFAEASPAPLSPQEKIDRYFKHGKKAVIFLYDFNMNALFTVVENERIMVSCAPKRFNL